MSEGPHTNNLVIRLLRLYGEPKVEDKAGFFAEYARAMQGYSREEREQAADRIMASHRFKTWPSIPECLQALDDVRFASKVKAEAVGRTSYMQRLHREKQDRDAWSIEAELEANQLIQSGLGRLAAEQGWILGLHDFCRKHRRLPDPVKEAAAIAAMKEAARYVDEHIDKGVATLRDMALKMRAKRGKLRALVLREDEAC